MASVEWKCAASTVGAGLAGCTVGASGYVDLEDAVPDRGLAAACVQDRAPTLAVLLPSVGSFPVNSLSTTIRVDGDAPAGPAE